VSEYLTLPQVAELVGVGEETVRARYEAGELPATTRFSSIPRVPRALLDATVAQWAIEEAAQKREARNKRQVEADRLPAPTVRRSGTKGRPRHIIKNLDKYEVTTSFAQDSKRGD
jgi:hypothetical protein